MAEDPDVNAQVPSVAVLRPVAYSPRQYFPSDDLPKVLFLLPGSRSLAQWCMDVRDASEKENWGVDVRIVPFTPPAIWQVILFPKQRRLRMQVKRQLDKMFTELPPTAEIFLAAHSFGTDVLIRWLWEHVNDAKRVRHIFRFGRRINAIILISGIAKRKHISEIRGACNVLANYVAVDDRYPSWAAGLARRWYDDIGTTGVVTGAARPVDRYFKGKHGTLIAVQNVREKVLPIIYGLGVPDGDYQGPQVAPLYLLGVRILRGAAFIAGFAGLLWGGSRFLM